MKQIPFDNPKELAAVLVRRKWWVIVSATLAFMACFFYALILPPSYVSETLILIEPREVPDDFVKDLISVDSDQRLNAIRETVLSRTNLLAVYRQFSNDLPEMANMNNEGRMLALRSSIQIAFERPRGRNLIHYFRISYEHRTPETAQKITRRLAELFINYDSKNREEQVFGTGEFLMAELEKVQTQLSQADEALAILKTRYRYELPEQLETNLRALDRLQEERRTNAEALDRFVSLRLTLERQISETPPVIIESLTPDRTADGVSPVSPLVLEYRQKERAFQELTGRYTDQHPDVRRARAELERLRAEIPAEDFLEIEETDNSISTRTKPNPLYQKLVGQLREVSTEIEIRERDKSGIDAQIQLRDRRVTRTPQRELEIASMQREFDELQRRYDDLSGKLSQTRLAESLESRQKGEQFRIMDPASLPLQPSKPNRRLIVALGFLGSLAFGVGLAVGRDFLDQRFWTHTEVEDFYKLPVLAEIPEIQPAHGTSGFRYGGLVRVGLFAVVILVCTSLLVLAYTKPQVREWGAHKIDRISSVFTR